MNKEILKTLLEIAENKLFFDSCGKCLSCQKFDAGAHPDFQTIYKELLPFTKEGKSKTSTPIEVPIDVIREFLIEKVGIRPALSHASVFVIEEAQKLNKESQNALLKTLEEPPPYCSIILLCTRLEDLLPTTQSRCQIVNFGPIDEQIIIEKLREKGISQEEATYWARFSQGSVGSALKWSGLGKIDETKLVREKHREEKMDIFQIKKDLVDRLMKCELTDSVEFEEWLNKQADLIADCWEKIDQKTSKKDLSRRAINGVLAMISAALNDAMKLNVGIGENLINDDQRRQIAELAKKYDADAAAAGIAAVYKASQWLEASVNEKLIFEDLLLNLTANAII